MDDEQAWSYTLSCSSRNGSSFGIALVAFNCFILAVGTYLAFELRHIDGTFNETKYLGMAIYNTTIITVIVLPLVYVFRDTYPTFVTAFRSIFILYCAAFVLLIVSVPKYLSIRKTQEEVNENSTHTNTNTHRDSRNSKRVSSSAFPRIRTGDVPSRTQLMSEFMSTLPDAKKLTRLQSYATNTEIFYNEIKYLIATLQQDQQAKVGGHNNDMNKPDEQPLSTSTGTDRSTGHELRDIRLNGLSVGSAGVRPSSSISSDMTKLGRPSMSVDVGTGVISPSGRLSVVQDSINTTISPRTGQMGTAKNRM
jgi:hypothetical protein